MSVRRILGGLCVLGGGYLMFDAWDWGPVTETSSAPLMFGAAIMCLGFAVLLFHAKDSFLELLTLGTLLAAGCFILTAILAARAPGAGRVLTPLAAGFLALSFLLIAVGVMVGHAFPTAAAPIFVAAFWSGQIGLLIGVLRASMQPDVPSAVASFWIVVAVTLIRTAFLGAGRKAALGFLILGLIEAAASVGGGTPTLLTPDRAQGVVLSIVCLVSAWALRRPQPPGIESAMAYLLSDGGVRR